MRLGVFQSNHTWLHKKLSKAGQIVDALEVFYIVVVKSPCVLAITIAVCNTNNFLTLSVQVREESLQVAERINRGTLRLLFFTKMNPC